ncbi:DNA-binding transcriptional MerR regulator [Kutzneria viridogrisea]|uniref:DNA-binding transcriptional MerR regulator n=1 Tax=Kutzneria viridogrisea TaxID=47990 RepID=A0ABR6BMA7_9PSEU|nr:DNA-binding transcriptional MerR regulator [Kutzneria viridogrisea]
MSEQRWSVGAVAKVAGLTVRTLHHYDELGLLRPSERTASGHRRYTEPDLRRLYEIRLLRELGLSLEEIGGVLDQPGALRPVLAARVDELDQQVRRINALRRQAETLLSHLDSAGPFATERPMALLGQLSVFGEYLTEEQGRRLDQHGEQLDAEAREWMEGEWPVILAELAEHFRAGTPVDDPAVVRSARRLTTLMETFTGGDAELNAAVAKFFREHGTEVMRSLTGGPDPAFTTGLWDYVSQAYSALR